MRARFPKVDSSASGFPGAEAFLGAGAARARLGLTDVRSLAVGSTEEMRLVEDASAARAFVAAPRTSVGRVSLAVGRERLELNRWGTLLVSGLVAGAPKLGKVARLLRSRRMKRPTFPATRVVEATAPVSTAMVAPPLDGSAPAAASARPDRATRRAIRRVRRYATDPVLVATDGEATRAFLTCALATSDPVVATYGDHKVTFTADGSRAVLGLFCTGRLRLAFAHLLLGAERFRPAREAPEPPEPPDPADPWGPFHGGSPFST